MRILPLPDGLKPGEPRREALAIPNHIAPVLPIKHLGVILIKDLRARGGKQLVEPPVVEGDLLHPLRGTLCKG